jgi:hypothetical protein
MYLKNYLSFTPKSYWWFTLKILYTTYPNYFRNYVNLFEQKAKFMTILIYIIKVGEFIVNKSLFNNNYIPKFKYNSLNPSGISSIYVYKSNKSNICDLLK